MKAPAQSESSFVLAPPGTHSGYLTKIIDLGTTYNDMYNKDQHKVCFMYELSSALMEPNDEGVQKPFVIAEFLTLSMNEKANLRKRIEAWQSRGFNSDEEAESFEIGDLLGKAALITVIHVKKQDKKTDRASIASVIDVPQGMQMPERVADLLMFDFENYSEETLGKLSDKMQEMIRGSQEYEAMFNPNTTNQNHSVPASQKYEADAKADAKSEQQQPPADFDDDIPF